MTVTTIDKDLEAHTLTVIADFDAPVKAVWELWSDPRKLERWWGPPSHPAKFERHELEPSGSVAYHMTGPEGHEHHGWWRVEAVEPPSSLEFTDGFADQQGNPVDGMPVSATRVRLFEHEGGTRMEMRSTYESREQLERVIEMGALEGTRQAVGQMDALLTG